MTCDRLARLLTGGATLTARSGARGLEASDEREEICQERLLSCREDAGKGVNRGGPSEPFSHASGHPVHVTADSLLTDRSLQRAGGPSGRLFINLLKLSSEDDGLSIVPASGS